MFAKQISWVSKETHFLDHTNIHLSTSSIKFDHRFPDSGNTKVLKYECYNDNIR
ncbi:unnamed protein product [Lupinus luteus]|uniref:Uncharacterized protein n=1 Tax=Lupinus luteus TaxID=3873 RepID=A0AAV1W269_LUPLU